MSTETKKVSFVVAEKVERVVASRSQVVNVVSCGSQGPRGASSGSTEPFYFMTPLSTWVVNHNLGRRPVVSVFSVGGVEMFAEIIHTSTNQCQVMFDDPVTGYAICS